MILGKTTRASVLAGAFFVGSALVSGCTSTTPGTATPAASSPGASSQAPADANVPKVATPLNASKYENDPCGLVPKDELSRLKFTDPGEPRLNDGSVENEAGPNCGWKIKGEGISLLVILGTGNRNRGGGGLAGIQANYERPNGVTKFLERAPDVEGYPAIYEDTRDRRPNGFCSMAIGIADDLAVHVVAGGYEGQQDSCDAAQGAAAGIVRTLKGA
ncbi:DUF3558 domain-containing protein [Amycolatopsis kentuckyensis]|uniref:DUF3558 domain-containing protein n=1 Tax=Amycolatopsis kentuckyensis TaxID=218823 RepID=UPI0035639F2F